MAVKGTKSFFFALTNHCMMDKLIKTFFLVLFSTLATAQGSKQQQLDINSQTVFKDSQGNQVGFDTFIEWTSGNDYDILPVFNEDGSLKWITINKISLNTEIKPSEFASTPELVERTPPKFEGYDMQNQFISLDNYKEKVVVIKFWFAACPPCIKEIPKLNKVFNLYKNNPDVVFLAPSLDDIATIQASNRRHPFLYKIMPRAEDFAQSYNVLGYPTHVVINKKGTVESVFQGVNLRIDEKLTRAIESALLRVPNDTPANPTEDFAPEEEVMINPNSVIVDEQGIIVPFEQFVQMMDEGDYELMNSKDLVGNKVIMIKEVVRN